MGVLQWLRADLRRPGRSVETREWPFLAGSSVVIILIAQISDPATWPALVLLLVGSAALIALALTNVPIELLATLVITAVGLAVGTSGRVEASLFIFSVLTVYTAWHLGSAARSGFVALLAIAMIAVVSLINPEEFAWAPWVAAGIFTFVLGRVLFAQREVITALELAREELAGQAVAEERRRIARELHDLAGHTLAAMMLHVTGARHVLRRDLDEADEALHDAEAVGRSGLAQVRTTVAALRTTEQGLDPPLPRAVDIDQILEDSGALV
ncbi:MAG: histidine kinase dimerization/phosphoacceptor domain-containing protein [Ornithinimicrobium sp.]